MEGPVVGEAPWRAPWWVRLHGGPRGGWGSMEGPVVGGAPWRAPWWVGLLHGLAIVYTVLR
jgi:hypothetical protein